MVSVACYVCGSLIDIGNTVRLLLVDGKITCQEFVCCGYEAFLIGASYVSKGVYVLNM